MAALMPSPVFAQSFTEVSLALPVLIAVGVALLLFGFAFSRAIRRRRERLNQEIFHQLPHPALLADRGGAGIFANEVWRSEIGTRVDGVSALENVFGGVTGRAALDAVLDAVRQRKTESHELVSVDAENRRRHCHA